MKKMIIITLVILSIVAFAFIFFDSSNTVSNNNEGLRKSDVAVSKHSGLVNNQQSK